MRPGLSALLRQLRIAGSRELTAPAVTAAATSLVFGAHPPSISAGTQDGVICLSHPLLQFAVASLRSVSLNVMPHPTC